MDFGVYIKNKTPVFGVIKNVKYIDEGLDLVKGIGNSSIRFIDAGGDIRKAGKHRINFAQEGLSTAKSVVENGVDKINPLKHKVFGQSLEFNLQFFGKHGEDWKKISKISLSKLLIKFKADEAVKHFEKHSDEIMKVFGKNSYNLKEYIEDANYVIRTGEYSKEAHAYYKLIGGKGSAKFAFVGLDRVTNEITTFHIKSVHELIKRVPSSNIVK